MQVWLPVSQLVWVVRAQVSLVADARVVVTVVQDAEPGRISPEARQTSLVVALAELVWQAVQQTLPAVVQAEPVWLPEQQILLEVVLAELVWQAVQQTSPAVARAELVSAQSVPLAFRQSLSEQVQ